MGLPRDSEKLKIASCAILQNKSAAAPLNLWITGHSLGGALSTLLTAKIMLLHSEGQLLNVNVIGSYSYGAPRVGSRDFANAFDTMAQKQGVSVVRFRNHADHVTTVPAGITGLGGYWHVGTLAYIDESKAIYFRDGWVEVETKSDLRSTLKLDPTEHGIKGYYAAVKKGFDTNSGQELSTCALQTPNVPPLPFYENRDMRK
ncbi:MAG: lipase family protein [Chitinophagaceae bacterium]|nr:lipase family protein [Oligoflexus sp.]